MTAPEPVGTLAEVLAGHRYRDVLGDYDIEPYRKHIGCSCEGWVRDIGGMSGYWSWLAAHEAHLAAAALSWLAAKGQQDAVVEKVACAIGDRHMAARQPVRKARAAIDAFIAQVSAE